MEIRIVTCDRCKAEVFADLRRLQEITGPTSDFIDLCAPCLRKFRAWLAEGETEEEDES